MTPHQDDDKLLKTISQNPDDDLPRLVYADWLEENGQPERAHFIRVQCEKASWRAETLPLPDRSGEFARRLEIDARYHTQVAAAKLVAAEQVFGREAVERRLRRHLTVRQFLPVDLEFRRGFVHTVRGPLTALLGGECTAVPCRQRRAPRTLPWGRDDVWVCPWCENAGVLPPALTILCRSHPVEEVEVTDKRAALGPRGSNMGAYFEPGLNYNRTDQLPFEFCERAGWVSGFLGGGMMVYPFTGLPVAANALNKKVLKLAKQGFSLPPVPLPQPGDE